MIQYHLDFEFDDIDEHQIFTARAVKEPLSIDVSPSENISTIDNNDVMKPDISRTNLASQRVIQGALNMSRPQARTRIPSPAKKLAKSRQITSQKKTQIGSFHQPKNQMSFSGLGTARNSSTYFGNQKRSMHIRCGSQLNIYDSLLSPTSAGRNRDQSVCSTSRHQQEVTSQRLMEHKNQQDSRRELAYLLKMASELKECSFVPSVNNSVLSPGSQTRRRSPVQFYQDQLSYQGQTMMKVVKKYEEQLEEEYFSLNKQPHYLCKGSDEMLRLKERSPSPVYDRLYNIQPKSPQLVEYPFSPTILSDGSRREKPVGEILYEDAQRRFQSRKMSEADALILEAMQRNPDLQGQNKSDEYLKKQFDREFREAYQELDLHQKNIELRKAEDLLVHMHFMSSQSNEDKIEMLTLWEYLLSTAKQNVILSALKEALSTLMFDYGHPIINRTKFPRFWQNRHDYCEAKIRQGKLQKAYKDIKSPTFKPQINNRFNTGRNSVQISTSKNRHDFLLKQGSQYNSNREEKVQEKLKVESSICTFKPQMAKGSIQINKSKSRQTFRQSKNITSLKQSFAQSREDYIKNDKSLKLLAKPERRPRNIRKNKENQKPHNILSEETEAITSGVFSEQNDEDPLIYVDIHINAHKVERLAIFKGDHYEEVIKRFCLKHGKVILIDRLGLSLKEQHALKDSLSKHIPQSYVDLID